MKRTTNPAYPDRVRVVSKAETRAVTAAMPSVRQMQEDFDTKTAETLAQRSGS